jgi:hypothetical protein
LKEHKKLDDKIKSSFESLNKKAPDMLWNQLANSLPTNLTATTESQPEDDRLYNKIRDSFFSLRQKAPQHAWEHINRQLNIDLVWSRLNRELDKSPSANWQVARWAAVLLLLMLSFAGVYYWNNWSTHPDHAGGAGNALNLPVTPTEKEMAVEVGQAELTNIREETEKAAMPGAQSPKEILIADGKQKNLITSFQPSPKDKQQKEPASSGFSHHIKDDTNRRSNDALIAGDDQASASTGFLSDRNSGSAGKSIASNSTTPIPYRIAGLPMGMVVKETTFTIYPVPQLVADSIAEEVLAEAGKGKRIRQKSFSLGPVLAYNNSWLLNNETRNSFDKGSLISTSPTYKQNLGIALHYSFNDKSGFASEFHFISKVGQEYSTFSDGYYQKMGLELSYYKLYLQYQRNFFPHRQSLLSNLTVKTGLYGGLLHRKNGEIRHTESTYNRFDYGVRFAFGQEKRISRMIIGYGISGERGLTNIFMGSDKMPARFNKTYTLNFGPYLNFRYH